jgi:hypothetical protein
LRAWSKLPHLASSPFSLSTRGLAVSFWRPGLIVTADEALSEEGEFGVTLPGGDSISAHSSEQHSSLPRRLLFLGGFTPEPIRQP